MVIVDPTLDELVNVPLLSTILDGAFSDVHWLGQNREERDINAFLSYIVGVYDGGLRSTTFTGSDNSVYMTRYTLIECRGAPHGGGHIYLDHIHRADVDDDPHDHPWDCTVLRLVNTYVDWQYDVVESGTRCGKCGRFGDQMPRQKYCGAGDDKDNHHDWGPAYKTIPNPITRRPGDVYRMEAGQFHRIDKLESGACWSLLATGVYKNSWGFWDPVLRRKVGHLDYKEKHKRVATVRP